MLSLARVPQAASFPVAPPLLLPSPESVPQGYTKKLCPNTGSHQADQQKSSEELLKRKDSHPLPKIPIKKVWDET